MKTIRLGSSTLLQASTHSALSSCRAAYLTTGSFRPTNHDRQHLQQRTFLSNPFGSTTPQSITAHRTLPYSASTIYNIISDVSSYHHYFPFCQQSVVTKMSQPAANGKKYPEEAKLVIGFNDSMQEEFWSRVYCVPETVVEAVSGSTQTSLGSEATRHHNPRPPSGQDPTRKGEVLSHLLTRWTLRPDQVKGATEVDLAIELQFANPLYAAMSQSAVPKVAEKMIDAFEKRLKEVAQDGSK